MYYVRKLATVSETMLRKRIVDEMCVYCNCFIFWLWVKCGMETAERRLLVHRSDHVSAGITQFTARRGKLRNGDVESSVLCMLP